MEPMLAEEGGLMRRHMRRGLGVASRQLADFGVLTTAPCVLDVGARVVIWIYHFCVCDHLSLGPCAEARVRAPCS